MQSHTFPKPEQIRAARSLLGWSQNDLATKAGVAVSTVADFERGQRNPVPNNASAIQNALESGGVKFTEAGVNYNLCWMFMTEQGMSALKATYTLNHIGIIIDLVNLFGNVDSGKFSINVIQQMTPELRSKVDFFVERHSHNLPQLRRLSKLLTDMSDGEFFLLIPYEVESSNEQHKFEQRLYELNHPQDQSLAQQQSQIFGELLDLYNLCIPRTDKYFQIGNPRKADRVCRFCGGTAATKAFFKKEAHAIPAALGNKYLKLADECDECNQYFGDEIEPTLVELLNIQRVFLGIEARGGLPTVEFAGGKMFRAPGHDKLVIVASNKISQDPSGVLTAQLSSKKPIVPQTFYRALAKIALSVIPTEELSALTKTVHWVRYGQDGDQPLPKIATAVVMLPPEPSAQISLYIRKEPHASLPHVVCEFRLGCYMYVYVLPFSKKDEASLIGFFDNKDFKDTFRHYGFVPSWNQQDYSSKEAILVNQNIKVHLRNP